MEKSIESIWKEGFLNKDALVAPKIMDLYNKKSIHIIDKFKRMFKINLIAIVVFSSVFLVVSFFIGIPIMGIIFFITLGILVIINKRLLSDLEKIDKGDSSYQYLKAFNDWIKEQVSINERGSRFLYPIIFLSFVIGFWFKDAKGMILGERLVNKLLNSYPEMYLIQGVPLVGIIAVLVVVIILAMLGGIIYRWDLNIVYGRVFRKLKELLTDMEELKNN